MQGAVITQMDGWVAGWKLMDGWVKIDGWVLGI